GGGALVGRRTSTPITTSPATATAAATKFIRRIGDLDAFECCAGRDDIPLYERRKGASREITISPPLLRVPLRGSHMPVAPSAKLR
ncbi:MAG: hypothetical protein ACM3O6_11045, partial [Acidobacteriota bacterium]